VIGGVVPSQKHVDATRSKNVLQHESVPQRNRGLLEFEAILNMSCTWVVNPSLPIAHSVPWIYAYFHGRQCSILTFIAAPRAMPCSTYGKAWIA
jgi:hypothetical protein